MVETRPLLRTVAHRIAETLHVPRVAILLNDGGRLQSRLRRRAIADAAGRGDPRRERRPSGACSATRTRASDSTIPIRGCTTCRNRSGMRCAAFQSDVLLPLSLNQKLLGVMSLGPKRSEEPYSSSDLRMLGSVATQTGLALENSRLTAQIRRRSPNARSGRRELEIAREVQERLFPQAYPPVPGLEYAGVLPAGAGSWRRLLRLLHAFAGGARPRDRRHLGQGHSRGAPDGHAARLPARADDRRREGPGRDDAQPQLARLRELRDEPLRHVLLRPLQRRHARARLRERRAQCADGVPRLRRQHARHRSSRYRRTGDRAAPRRAATSRDASRWQRATCWSRSRTASARR